MTTIRIHAGTFNRGPAGRAQTKALADILWDHMQQIAIAWGTHHSIEDMGRLMSISYPEPAGPSAPVEIAIPVILQGMSFLLELDQNAIDQYLSMLDYATEKLFMAFWTWKNYPELPREPLQWGGQTWYAFIPLLTPNIYDMPRINIIVRMLQGLQHPPTFENCWYFDDLNAMQKHNFKAHLYCLVPI